MSQLTIQGKALAIVDSWVAVNEVLEIVVFIFDRADLVIFVDEIPTARRYLSESELEDT